MLKMNHREGRSDKAAKLHSIDKIRAHGNWKNMMKTGHEQRGGDKWRSRGENGVWCRIHTTPRISLFTPYKVAQGPCGKTSMRQTRFTSGVTESGECFEFHDDWTLPQQRHKIMEEAWVGFTMFVERDCSLEKSSYCEKVGTSTS